MKWFLVGRISATALVCFAVVTTILLVEIRLEELQRAETTADLVARHLEFQVLRANTGFDSPKRFPDWDAFVDNSPLSGLCIRFLDEREQVRRSDCVGTVAARDEAPAWFAAFWSNLMPSHDPVRRNVTYHDQLYGSVVVSSDPKEVMARAWHESRNLFLLTGLTILALSFLIYFAVGRALAPTKAVVGGLNRMADGDFGYRLPSFQLAEFQRIGEVANQLAQTIETTLSQRADLTRRLMNAQEHERRYLARELHDEFAQNLTAINALAASLQKTAEHDCPALRPEAESLAQISMSMMTSLRGTLVHLKPADLEKFGLVASLKQLVAVWNSNPRNGAKFEFRLPEEIGPVSADAAVHVFRIAQEGLTNAAKHAEAKHVILSLKPVPMGGCAHTKCAGIQLSIEDDGKGSREALAQKAANGMGILNMYERVAALGGTIAFEDRPEAGISVRVTVPINDNELAAT